MKLLILPSGPPNLQGPYLYHLVSDLTALYGVELAGETDWLSARWLIKNRHRPPLLHFHWTHYHYTYPSQLRSCMMFLSFLMRMLLAKGLGYKIVWTMHNFLPHEQPYPILHRLDRWLMARIANAVIVHCERGRLLLARAWHRTSNVYTIPLGDFASRMPRFCRGEAHGRIALARQRLTIIHFGGIRAYKGLDQLIRVFRQLDKLDANLLIVGKPASVVISDQVAESVRGDSRITTVLRYVKDDELAVHLCAADVAVLPFNNVLTSASAITALSFGLPVIAPAVGCLPEVVTGESGILYDGTDQGLTESLLALGSRDLSALKQAATRRAEELAWSDMVRKTYEVYQSLLFN